ncbi:SDR family oxidoreductase [Ectothiorhodospiraceae bacterium BW-2]|nr:SDR family oxidoreductase [Ectothiorhodospiraceae bacterium BW-2]
MPTDPIPPSERPAALVTGGAIRLGRALALDLAAAGYDIALHYGRSAKAAATTCDEIRQLGVACEPFELDLASCRDFKPWMAQIKTRFPRLEVLVNSASGYVQQSLMASEIEAFDQLHAVNLRAPLFLIQAFATLIGRGCVVNIIDNKVGFNQFKYASYLLTKKSLAELTKMAALELAPNIRVNGVSPGVTLPAGSRSEAYIRWRIEAIPLKRKGETDHIAAAIRFILSNDFINGQILTIDGGENIAHVGLNAGDYDQSKI